MNNPEIYDIIIENVKKEVSIMNQYAWEIPKYSRKQINKAGKIIANKSNYSESEYQYAIEILNNWRASHAYPLHVITCGLRNKFPMALVVQRIKRLESIAGKIERFPEMELFKMQDLGGCRVIVDNIEQVYELSNRYKESRIRHILKRTYDYIENPKESGYRCYHCVYQFQSDSSEVYNKNMLIEIQFRTKLQHTWATAVEMMGIYTKSNLKSSQGNEDILRFFLLVSSVFAIIEKTNICPNTPLNINDLISEIRILDQKYNIISILSGLTVSIDYSDKKKFSKNTYFLLILDYDKRKVAVRAFKPTQLEVATKAYSNIEEKTNKDVVLVSASSFDAVKTAYPNYFIDISNFVDMMRKILK